MTINPFLLLEHTSENGVLTSLTNPKNVPITDEAVEIPADLDGNTLTQISRIADLNNVVSLVIPASVTEIKSGNPQERRVFFSCDALEQITVYDSLKAFGQDENSFYVGWVTSPFLPSMRSTKWNPSNLYAKTGTLLTAEFDESVMCDNIEKLGKSVDEICKTIRDISNKLSYDTTHNIVFENCPKFYKLIIRHAENSSGMIQPTLCRGLHELREVEIGDGVSIIGDDAFAYCVNLKNIYIPSSVTGIRYSAFHYCTKLHIYGLPGTYAETYAKMFGFPFHEAESLY